MDELQKGNSGQLPENVEHADGDWEVELVSALVESLGREENEDVGESDITTGGYSFITNWTPCVRSASTGSGAWVFGAPLSPS